MARVAAPSLVERAAQLAQLEAAWSAVRSGGSGQVVLVGGEAGAGKSALVRAFTDGIDRVLRGAGDALQTARPLGPIQDVAQPGGRLAAAIERGARPFEVASALLDELSPPVVVVLEDLHWADEATLDVLRLIVRRLEGRAVLVVGTYRDDELGYLHPLRVLLGELAPSLRRIAVPPLSADAVGQLAAPHGVDPAELHRKTGGNAFFVTEALATGDVGIPDSVRDAVLARAARLGERSRAVLETVAMVPLQAELWLLKRTAADGTDWAGGLDACVAAGILHTVGDVVAFRHELARLAVAGAVPPVRRQGLHAAIVEALSDPPDGPADAVRLAHHAHAAGQHAAVVRFARQAAAEAAAVGAHREAAAQYARVLEHGAGLEPAERAAVLTAHSRESHLADDGDAAIASAQAAADARRRLGDHLGEVDALLWLGTVERMAGRLVDSAASLGRARRILDREPSGREAARAFAAAAVAAMTRADAEEALATGGRAMELAEQAGDTETYLHALITVATMRMGMADGRDAGRAELLRSVELAKDAELHELVGRAYNNLIYETGALFELDTVAAYAEAAVEYATRHGVEVWLHIALGSLAEAQLARGDWDAAADTAGRVLARPVAAVPRMGPLTVLGLIRARRGDPDPWGPLDDALDIARGSGELQMLVPVAAARAEAAWLEGRPDAVLAESEAVVRRAVTAGDAWALTDLAYWRRQVGADDALPDLPPSPRRTELEGRPDLAARRWTELGYRYEAALALANSGSEAAGRQALDELRALGAGAAAAVVARRLRAQGARGIPRGPRPSTAGNSALLTRRELEVVQLLADGLGNGEIAQRLFLSEKTVGHHVSAVLRKLGVTSRGGAAAEALRRGLVGQSRESDGPI